MSKIQRVKRIYCEKLYANKLDNLEELIKFLETYSLPRWNTEETGNLNRLITSEVTDSVLENLPTKKVQDQRA